MKKLKMILMSAFLLFAFCQHSGAQTSTEKKPVYNKKFMETYEKSGVDKAISEYKSMKAKESGNYLFDEHQLNFAGYTLMEKKKYDDAEKVFKLNISEYPNRPNPYDSYADLMSEMGKKDEAVKYYKMSVEKSNAMPDGDKDFNTRVQNGSLGKAAILEGKADLFEPMIGKWKGISKNPEGMPDRTYTREFKKIAPGTILVENKNDLNETYVAIYSYNAKKNVWESVDGGDFGGMQIVEMQVMENTPEKIVLNQQVKSASGNDEWYKSTMYKTGNKVRVVGESSKDGKVWTPGNEQNLEKM